MRREVDVPEEITRGGRWWLSPVEDVEERIRSGAVSLRDDMPEDHRRVSTYLIPDRYKNCCAKCGKPHLLEWQLSSEEAGRELQRWGDRLVATGEWRHILETVRMTKEGKE